MTVYINKPSGIFIAMHETCAWMNSMNGIAYIVSSVCVVSVMLDDEHKLTVWFVIV